jgi:DNA invertase Pin-like site-specific DNA recombinase
MGSIVGYYVRSSHYLQNLGVQTDRIESDWKVYEDKGVSGRVMFSDRPSGKKLLQDVERGRISMVITNSSCRIGRNVRDSLDVIRKIHSFGVPIRFIREGITTLDENGQETSMGNLMINILTSISEFQYHQIREKTLMGIERGKLEGKYRGRKTGSVESLDKFKNKPKVKKIRELLKEDVGVRKISRVVGCSPNYIYKVKEMYMETT